MQVNDKISIMDKETKEVLAEYKKSDGWNETTALNNYILKNNESERSRCEVWTRVMGYHRPVTEFNPGKQQEHEDRKSLREPTSDEMDDLPNRVKGE